MLAALQAKNIFLNVFSRGAIRSVSGKKNISNIFKKIFLDDEILLCTETIFKWLQMDSNPEPLSS